MEKSLTLCIVTPDGTATEPSCTSLRLPVLDDKSGHGGGSYGIHPGHLPAVFALSESTATAYTGTAVTATAQIQGGIARVTHDTVVILTDSCILETKKE